MEPSRPNEAHDLAIAHFDLPGAAAHLTILYEHALHVDFEPRLDLLTAPGTLYLGSFTIHGTLQRHAWRAPRQALRPFHCKLPFGNVTP